MVEFHPGGFTFNEASLLLKALTDFETYRLNLQRGKWSEKAILIMLIGISQLFRYLKRKS